MRRRSTGIRRIRFITTCSFTFRFAPRRKSLSTNARLEHARRARVIASVSECTSTHLSISDTLFCRRLYQTAVGFTFVQKKTRCTLVAFFTLNTRVFHSGKGAGRECWQFLPKLAEHSGANLSYARRQFMQHLWKGPKFQRGR